MIPSALIMGWASRAMANPAETVPTLNVDRLTNITNSWGGNATNVSVVPDFGTLISTVVGIYPEHVGVLAWVVLFALPFIMMWITNSDMVPAGVIGIFFGAYIFGFVGSQFAYVGIVFIVIAISSIVWSMWQKRG